MLMSNQTSPGPVFIPYRRNTQPRSSATPEQLFDATTRLPEYLRNLLLSPPKQGTGLHQWVFSCVRGLKRCRNDNEIVEIMNVACSSAPRDLTREVREALRSIVVSLDDNGKRVIVSHSGGTSPSGSPLGGWPVRNPDLIGSISPVTPQQIAGFSPSSRPTALSALTTLFDPSELVCMASSPSCAHVRPLLEWLPVCDSLPLMVASPMTAVTGVNLSGKTSNRCLSNTGPRRYAVVEFDSGSGESQLGRIMHLAKILPPTMILHSGGKSYHSWFHVSGLPDETVTDFLRGAAILGADPAVFVRCQLVRVPGGLRDGVTRQPVLYFDDSRVPSF